MAVVADPHRIGVTLHLCSVWGAPGADNPTTAPAVVSAVELEGWMGRRKARKGLTTAMPQQMVWLDT